MKKILYIVLFIGSSVVFTSCASGDECVCDNGVTITEEDAKDAGASLSESCMLAGVGGANCEIQ